MAGLVAAASALDGYLAVTKTPRLAAGAVRSIQARLGAQPPTALRHSLSGCSG